MFALDYTCLQRCCDLLGRKKLVGRASGEGREEGESKVINVGHSIRYFFPFRS